MGKYQNFGKEIGDLLDVKQAAYGDSFGKSGNILRHIFPDGIKPTQYDDVLTIARMLDKIMRIATSKDALGEDPYADLAGYSILAVVRNREQQKKKPVRKKRS